MAVGARERPALAAPPEHRGRARRGAAVAVGSALALVAGTSYALPWLAAEEVDRALSTWRENPPEAFDALERARRLDFLSEEPDLVAGAIASRLGDRRRMRRAFVRVAERNPSSWYAHLELAIVDALDGRRADALRRLARARALNPSEPAITLVLERVRARKPVSPRTVDRMFLQRVEARSS